MNKKSLLIVWILTFILLIGFVSATINWGSDVLTYNPLWEYETSATGLLDISSNGNDMTAFGNAQYNVGKTGFDFDGTEDYLRVSSTNFLTSQGSLSFWITPDALNTYALAITSSPDTLDELQFLIDSSGDVSFILLQDGVTFSSLKASTSNLVVDNTYHIVVTSDGSTTKMYINDSLYTLTAVTGTNTGDWFDEFDDSTYLYLGGLYRNSLLGDFNGEQSDFILFNRALTSTEISDLYTEGSNYNPYATGGFVYPTSVTDIVFSPASIYGVDDVSATVTVNDSTSVDLKYYWLVDGVNVTSGTVTTASANVFTIPSFDSSNYQGDDVIKLDVLAIYESNSSQASDTYFETITASNITVTDISLLYSTSPTNLYTDADVSAIITLDYTTGATVFYEWLVNSVVIDSNYYSTTGTWNIPLFASTNYVQGDNVSLRITPYDGSSQSEGLSVVESVTVSNRDPVFTSFIISPDPLVDGTASIFSCYFNDLDSDSLSVDWALYKNDVEFDSGNDTATVATSTLRFIQENVDGVNFIDNDVWYMTCEANDNFGGSTSIQTSSAYTVEDILNWTVSINDKFDVSAINTFWVYLESDGFSYNYTTSTGSIITDIFRTNTSLFNISYGSNGFITEYDAYTDVVLSSNSVFTLDQSRVDFDIFELITGDEINLGLLDVTYTVSEYGALYGNDYFPLPPGDYVVTVSADGYYDKDFSFSVDSLDVKTVDVTGVYNSVVTFTPKNVFDNSSVSSFNGWISTFDSVYNYTFVSTNGTAYAPFMNNTPFYYKVSSDSFASEDGNSTVNNSLFNVITYHYTFNSILINIYNDTTADLLTNTVNIDILWDGNSLSNTTSNGTFYYDFLTPEDYEVRFRSTDYLNTSIFLTLYNDSTNLINLHLPLAAGKELQRFLVIDEIGDVVSGAIIRLQEEVVGFSGLWQTQDEKQTNSDGEVGFYVDKSTNIFYRMIVIVDGEVELISDKTLFLPGVTEVISLQVDLSADGEAVDIDNVVTSLDFTGDNNESVSFSWVDPDNSIVGGRLLITTRDFNITGFPAETLYDISFSGSTGNLSYTLPVVNDTEFVIKGYILRSGSESLAESDIVIFGRNTIPDKDFGLLIAAFIVLLTAFVTVSLKPLFSIILSVSLIGILSGFGLMSIPTTVITSFIALAVIFFVKIKGGGQ